MSAGPRSRRRKAPSAHAQGRPARRWASAARRASRSAATRRTALAEAAARRGTAGGSPAKGAKGRTHRPGRPRERVRAAAVRAISGVPFALMDWIRRSMTGGLGPVANKEVFRHSDFVFQILKGPDRRNDFHLDPYDEIFYQLKGSVWVHLIGENGRRRVAEVKAGGVLLVSAFTPHSPRRPPGSLGLVVERPRREQELDGIAWYCEQCGHKLDEVWLPCKDIEVQLAGALAAFNADVARRTCERCGALLPDPAQQPPWRRDLLARKA